MIPRFFLSVIFWISLGLGLEAAPEKPNVILIMVDDMGFSDLGYHGGEIMTPHLDALARGGVRFSRFYNSGRCCPTRATLMTGLHPHETGIGWMTESSEKERETEEPPAYQGYLNRQCVTIAEVLKDHGYATLMTGKWHLGLRDEDCWPKQRGFDRFFGCIEGATRFFQPNESRGMRLDNERVNPVESTTDEAFYTTDAFTDYAIRFIGEHGKGARKDDPFFLYLAYTAPHWPLQAFEDDIAKYRGKYLGGWDKLRETRYRKQIELGLIDEKWVLSPKTPGIPDWDTLEDKQKDEMDLKMAVYAAMVDRVDQNIGKLVAFLEEQGTLENTLLFFLSDNGACQEGGMFGRGEFYDVEKRNLEHTNSYGEAWANAGSTPFRLYKHFAHEGGAATPFFMHWPAGIPVREDWYGEAGQLIDIMPTILDVAGATYPETAHGNEIPALDGISLRPAFSGKALGRENPIFIEHETNAFALEGDWKLVGRNVSLVTGTEASRWELYDLAADRTETRNLAEEKPDKVTVLAGKWEDWANRVGVYPRGKAGTMAGGPPAEQAKSASATPPQVAGRAFSVTATVRNPKPHGVAVSHGGVQFGYALHFLEGRPAFSIRNAGKLTELIAEKPVSGKVTVAASLDEKRLVLTVDGEEVAGMESPGLLVRQPAIGLYLGEDFQDPVGNYQVPNRFNGRILSHSVDAIPTKVAMRTEWGEKVTPENVWEVHLAIFSSSPWDEPSFVFPLPRWSAR